jgi:hypothetical protein
MPVRPVDQANIRDRFKHEIMDAIHFNTTSICLWKQTASVTLCKPTPSAVLQVMVEVQNSIHTAYYLFRSACNSRTNINGLKVIMQLFATWMWITQHHLATKLQICTPLVLNLSKFTVRWHIPFALLNRNECCNPSTQHIFSKNKAVLLLNIWCVDWLQNSLRKYRL